MQTVAYFGHDVKDAAIRRRIGALEQDGMHVVGFTKRRAEFVDPAWDNTDLGKTKDGALLQRILSIFTGAFRGWKARHKLKTADVIIARNLDMLACAILVNKTTGANLPIIYECLDVHRLMCREDLIGRTLRRLEAWLMSKTTGLILSSPAFLTEYFEKYHGQQERVRLVENRMVPAMITQFHRDADALPEKAVSKKLHLGWVGVLRCSRSLDIMCQLADMYPDVLQIELHGVPSLPEIPDFENRIKGHENITFHGRYKSPEDLERIYKSIDVVWSIDFMEAGQNSVWLLPNRIYEGGYFSVPAIALQETQTAKWLDSKGVGFIISEPLVEATSDLIERLLESPDLIAQKQSKLAALEADTFIQPEGFIKNIVLELVA